MEIGLISDTHGFLDPNVFEIFKNVDEIWHAGDFGALEVAKQLADFKPFRGVYGNIDDTSIRDEYPEDMRFEIEGVSIWMTHIAGRPGRYDRRVAEILKTDAPQLLICGHSHILRVEKDKRYCDMQYINPGAAGHHGSHLIRTLMKCEISEGEVRKLRVIELGPRGRTRKPAVE